MNNQQPWAVFDDSSNSTNVSYAPAHPSFITQHSVPSALPLQKNSENLLTAISSNDKFSGDVVAEAVGPVIDKGPRSVGTCDPWAIAPDQKSYYLAQFLRLQPDPSGYLGGLKAKTFFELSKLPVNELSDIWELSDVDADGQLTLSEFCVAMHLVVLRRNNVLLPTHLPETLLREATSSSLSATNPRPCQPPPSSSPSPPPLSGTSHQLRSVGGYSAKSKNIPDNAVGRARLQASCECHSFDSRLEEDSTEVSDPANNRDSFVAPRQRRWSTSSHASDAISLAEGLTTFDVRLAPNVQLYHPVPLRQPLLFPAVVKRSDAETAPETSVVPLDLFPTRVAAPMVRHPSGPTEVLQGSFARPPTPPPRTRPRAFTLTTHLPMLPSVDHPQKHISQTKTEQLSSVLLPLQNECEHVVQENNELTEELVMLQKRRIALEILLERLTPLEA